MLRWTHSRNVSIAPCTSLSARIAYAGSRTQPKTSWCCGINCHEWISTTTSNKPARRPNRYAYKMHGSISEPRLILLFFIFQAAVESPIRLCTVCGCRGPLKCGKCRASFYCGAAHQRIDWSLGEHKSRCGNDTNATEAVIYDCLFEEFELVTEPEPLPDTASTGESAEEAEQRRLRDYEEFMKTKEADEDLKDVPDDEFNKYATDIDEDVVFSKFRKRIAIEKEQVSRQIPLRHLYSVFELILFLCGFRLFASNVAALRCGSPTSTYPRTPTFRRAIVVDRSAYLNFKLCLSCWILWTTSISTGASSLSTRAKTVVASMANMSRNLYINRILFLTRNKINFWLLYSQNRHTRFSF